MAVPKISVIVPVYDVEDYLVDALDSLANQSLTDIEVLMIDDGSNDNSRHMVEKYALDYDNFHAFHKENEGLSVTRNYGLKYAKGEYIFFIDSDDYLLHDALEKLYNCAVKYDSDIVTANFFRYNDKKSWQHIISDYVFNSLENDLYNTNLFEYPNLIWDMPVWNKLYKKEFLDDNNLRFFDGRVIFEDNIFSTESYAKAKKVSVLKDGFYCWRMRAPNTSLSQSHDTNRGDELYKMAKMVNDIVNENIDDYEILSRKYMKWLTLDIPFYMSKIKTYPKEDHIYIFEGAHKLINLIPDEYFNELNTYYQVFYKMVQDKKWDELSELFFNDLKSNPNAPVKISDEYYSMFDFDRDAETENLKAYIKSITVEDNDLVVQFNLKLPFKETIQKREIRFSINSPNYSEVVIASNFINKDKLFIPLDEIKYGENQIKALYVSDFKKECFIETDVHKTIVFDEYVIDISRNKYGFLKLVKKERTNYDFVIESIELNDGKFQFIGHSNFDFERICIDDYMNFTSFEYPIEYESEMFFFEIDYNDFLKSPIKKWEFNFKDKYNKIILIKSFKKNDDNYQIKIKESKNKIKIIFKPYRPIEKINDLEKKLKKVKKENKRLKKKNKTLKKKSKKSKRSKISKKLRNYL
ncbi:glycosyltransferase family 2 protein [Methanobrevibacter thaueri]|uniref:Putative glycosyltransferase EpsJ n=1 Tax=Methanobrevibacter thaueri TaxID=190975 RepID=A0A315XQU2_9EURY|nr:glycosyltransferase [Methanobrevibacter thaueri]PWB88324.1 putative glycosyltransferase EpsJ [Methanobrevibacter thaueri]